MMMIETMDTYFLTKLSFITIAFDQTVRSLFWQSQSWEYRHVVGEPIKGRNIHPSSNDTRSALCLAPGAHPSTGWKSNLPPSLPLPNNSSLLGWQWGGLWFARKKPTQANGTSWALSAGEWAAAGRNYLEYTRRCLVICHGLRRRRSCQKGPTSMNRTPGKVCFYHPGPSCYCILWCFYYPHD